MSRRREGRGLDTRNLRESICLPPGGGRVSSLTR